MESDGAKVDLAVSNLRDDVDRMAVLRSLRFDNAQALEAWCYQVGVPADQFVSADLIPTLAVRGPLSPVDNYVTEGPDGLRFNENGCKWLEANFTGEYRLVKVSRPAATVSDVRRALAKNEGSLRVLTD